MLESFAGLAELKPYRVDGPVLADDGWWWAWQLVWAETEDGAYTGFCRNLQSGMPYHDRIRSRTGLLEGPFRSESDARRGKERPKRNGPRRHQDLARPEPDLRVSQAHEASVLEALAFIEPDE